ncbi:MAG: hypothetical protein NVSMB14_01040 [Isosphaeraceae bacterium]
MGATFNRVNAVVVDTFATTTDTGLYPDASLGAGGVNASSVVPYVGVIASYGQLWRGMPVSILPSTGKLVPPNAAGAIAVGVLTDDLTTYKLAQQVKITFAKRGRIRSYAGAALTMGQSVKVDTSANFSGFVPWVAGTDDPSLRVGRVFPLDDGSASNGASAATSMAQGDTIFVEIDFR